MITSQIKMSSIGNLTELPTDLPVPVDDGACSHLLEMTLPSIALFSTQGRWVDFSTITGCVVMYCYPRIGQPGIPLPDGLERVPGARLLNNLVHFEIIINNSINWERYFICKVLTIRKRQ
jgi:hypothetical protein